MFSFRKKSRGDVLGAVLASEQGTATAVVRQGKSALPELTHCAWQPLAEGEDPGASLRHAISAPGLNKLPCATLLAMGEYQLLMVEAPEVPPSELRAAIRWRIRDLIDFHIDDAVLDVFDVPPSGARGVQEHLYVVVARAALVKERIDSLQDAGAQLEIIDIPELALRNIAARLEQDKGGQAMLYFGPEQSLITLNRDATLYLGRGMDFGYHHLCQTPELVDRLALELQRSLDYYDRHFQQAPIASITLCPMPDMPEALPQQLEQQVGIPVQQVQLGDIVSLPSGLDTEQQAHCLLAIGAALRSEQAEL